MSRFSRRRPPLAPEKHQGGYAQIFAKNREKKTKASHKTGSTSQPVKALTTHSQNTTAFSPQYYEQTSSTHQYKIPAGQDGGRYGGGTGGTYSNTLNYTQAKQRLHQDTGQINHDNTRNHSYTQARLQQDTGQIDSQIQYYQSYSQNMHGKPHR